MKTIGLFDMFDKLVADELEVSLEQYIDTIDEFNDEDMEYIIYTLMDINTTPEEKEKARDLFKTKLK